MKFTDVCIGRLFCSDSPSPESVSGGSYVFLKLTKEEAYEEELGYFFQGFPYWWILLFQFTLPALYTVRMGQS